MVGSSSSVALQAEASSLSIRKSRLPRMMKMRVPCVQPAQAVGDALMERVAEIIVACY